MMTIGSTFECNPALAHTLRDIIGSPYEPITYPKPSTIIASLAQAAYEDQDTITGHLNPIRLNILADALEEANYPPEFTTHLHSPNHHVRGCWALDLILGKK
jgi:hypothetical protein